MSTEISIASVEPLQSRRANDYLVDPKRFRPPGMLFDEFWRSGEVALLFGPPASGKSVLAVQLGDVLARGTGLHGFRTPRGRRRVLYVDLRHTDEQFQVRSTDALVRMRRHKFPRNLFRDRPPAGIDLCDWLRAYSVTNKIQVAIIDDLAAVKNTHDGTRETLRLMCRLRAMRDELGISILVIADSNEPAHDCIAEADLGRSRVLCTVADSVFAVGRGRKRVDDHYLVQTRVRLSRPYWTDKNAPVANVVRSESGLLVFEFDERFAAKMDDKTRLLMVRLNAMRERGETFRTIAAELGISKSQAHELYQKWKPAIDRGVFDENEDNGSEGGQFANNKVPAPPPTQRADYFPGCEEYDEAAEDPKFDREYMDEDEEGYDPHEQALLRREGWILELARGEAHDAYKETGVAPRLRDHPEYKQFIECVAAGGDPFADETEPEAAAPGSEIEPSAPPGQLSTFDPQLSVRTDAYGDPIYVEKEDERGRPLVWYKIDRRGRRKQFRRTLNGITVSAA